MQEKEIIINGDKFVAEKLAPNYMDEFDCTCEECHFSLSWADFDNYKHCHDVNCIGNSFEDGNRNVWIREQGLDDIVLFSIECNRKPI